MNLDGVYVFVIENSKIIISNETSNNKTIEKYAIKISAKNNENGIIGKYIYKVRKEKNNSIVILMENENAVLHTKMIILFAISGSIISLIIIYSLAKKISKVIVKPIQETFQKQKQFISDASHELKTPLAVIKANEDGLEKEMGNKK